MHRAVKACDGDLARESGMDGGDVQSVEDVVCFDRRTPLVTTALGLMGYQVPQVCDLMMKHWLDTVHALLRHDRLTAPKLRHILDNVDWVLRDLKGQPLLELIEVLLKAAVHMKNMSPKSSSDSCTFVRTKCSGEGSDAAWATERILDYVVKEKEFLYNHFSPIARLQVWRLRPSLLKVDLSNLAKEAMRRRLLSLKVESGSCRTFGVMVTSLALAPDLLNEARRLLLMWSTSVRAVRLLELRAQLTVAVHGILQCSNATGSTLSDEYVWLHTMHSSSLRPFLQISVGVPTASALSHLVELMERRESSARTAANREIGVHERERSPKRQRRSYTTAGQNESLDDSSSNTLEIFRADEQTAGLRTKTNALFATDFCKANLNATTVGSLEGVDNCPLWILLADFLPWATFASQLLFQDTDVNTANCQSAAGFLGWLMCPSSAEGRAYATNEFLHAAGDWQSLCNEEITKDTQTSRSPGIAQRLSDLKDRKENFPLTICNLCGSPVNWTGGLVNGTPHHVSNSSAYQNLVAWLLRFCSLQSQLQQLNLKGGNGCKSVSKHQSYVDGMWKVIRVFPIASLSSDVSYLTPEVGGLLLSMILLGLTSGSKEVPTKEKPLSPRSCCTVCEDFHCVSCCYKDRHKSSEPPHRTEQIRNDARIEEDFYWAPFAAALFTYLDTNILASSAEPQPLLTQTSDPKVIVRRVVAACVHHWVQLTNQSTAMNPHDVETVYYYRRIQMLEDLHTRVSAWTDVTGADTELAQAVGNLKLQIDQFKHFCNI